MPILVMRRRLKTIRRHFGLVFSSLYKERQSILHDTIMALIILNFVFIHIFKYLLKPICSVAKY